MILSIVGLRKKTTILIYLTIIFYSLNVDPKRVRQLHKQTVENGWSLDFHTTFETMAYTSLQELATMVFYNNVAKLAGQHD
jgi:acyl-[acyl-carrier-protein] desaturase